MCVCVCVREREREEERDSTIGTLELSIEVDTVLYKKKDKHMLVCVREKVKKRARKRKTSVTWLAKWSQGVYCLSVRPRHEQMDLYIQRKQLREREINLCLRVREVKGEGVFVYPNQHNPQD